MIILSRMRLMPAPSLCRNDMMSSAIVVIDVEPGYLYNLCISFFSLGNLIILFTTVERLFNRLILPLPWAMLCVVSAFL